MSCWTRLPKPMIYASAVQVNDVNDKNKVLKCNVVSSLSPLHGALLLIGFPWSVSHGALYWELTGVQCFGFC